MQPCQSWAKPRRFGRRCLDQQTYPRSARNVGRSFASDRAEERSSSTWGATSCACHSATNSSAPAAPRAAWALPSWQCTEAASSEPCSFSSDASSTLAGSSDTFFRCGFVHACPADENRRYRRYRETEPSHRPFPFHSLHGREHYNANYPPPSCYARLAILTSSNGVITPTSPYSKREKRRRLAALKTGAPQRALTISLP